MYKNNRGLLKTTNYLSAISVVVFSFLFCTGSYAGVTMGNEDLGIMSKDITQSFIGITHLITVLSYVGGIALIIGAILKFKQHKDNPTQIPIGTPIALVFIGAALLFLPSILDVTGATMFGAGGGKTAGPTGIIYNTGS